MTQTPEEAFEKAQYEMFKDVFVFRMIEKIPVKNSHLRHVIAALIFIGIIMSPKIISSATKRGHGYLDMDAPEDIVQHRESKIREHIKK